ncbi:type II toxin-antitoxin system RelE/ParE family toxin [Sphingomonas sp. AP4-R1]|uniref:type II toxin-antitoxin system RelE/ParE family toxin n=1 Tax=Sphingomonas sp. AP4-R1 TaxID=2735134 RepID=UPI0014936A4E|nr:type II toxin-antitoxin system RelE/ParE family toxin [Sphingomonas sp. AP4-R1]QJU56971.1 type II toxin-antitoxin system RelE/ParE family toxin [Sphingomonas sp. AP4-R1]
MKLAWSNRAATDRMAIFVWIAEDNPQAAADVDERIEAAAQRLKDFPNSGRPGRIEGTRELVIARTPYVAPYQIIGDTVRILRVIHGARMWPHDIPPDFGLE